MSTRRDLFRILAVTSAAIPALASAQETKEVGDQPGHLHAGRAIQVPIPSQPTFFQPAEFHMVEALSERIIPRSDTPGAKDAGVALLIDKAVVASPSLGLSYRAGLADLNALAINSYGCGFTALTQEQQVHLLTPLSLEADTSLGTFFSLVKDMTVMPITKRRAA